MLILKDEHAIDVLKSGNTGHLWHDFHAIGVHATDVGHPDNGNDNDYPNNLLLLFASGDLLLAPVLVAIKRDKNLPSAGIILVCS